MLTKLTIMAAVAILTLSRRALGEVSAAKPDVARVPTLIERSAPAAAVTADHHLTFSARFIQGNDGHQDRTDQKKRVVKGNSGGWADPRREEGPSSRPVPTRRHQNSAYHEPDGQKPSRARKSKLKGRKETRRRQQQSKPRGQVVPRDNGGGMEADGQGCAVRPGSDGGNIGRRSARFVQMRRDSARRAL